MYCTCQMVSRNALDCAVHGAMLREKSARYQREQAQRDAAAAARRETTTTSTGR